MTSLAAPGCSALYDLGADQCEVPADCEQFGGDLPICSSGVCVAKTSPTGGSGGRGGEGGGGQPPAGEAGAGGSGEPPPECTRNDQCIDAHAGQPYLCLSNECVSLITDECPIVVGADNLRSEVPIVFGAYALAPDEVSRSTVVRNMDLAISEFTSKVTGLRDHPSGKSRTLAVVVCNSSYPDVPPGTIDPFVPSLEHLVDTLKVPGILSALSARDLQAVYSQKLSEAGTFVISPYEQDSELAAFSDGGRLWHLLGATSDLAPAFGPLLKRTEAYVQLLEENTLVPPLRVAVVTADIARETDVRDALLELPEIGDFEVEPYTIESALLTEDPDVSDVTADLRAFAPHIIVALAGSEFIQKVFPALEAGKIWNEDHPGQRRPMYLLGAAMAPETWFVYSPKAGDPLANPGYNTLMDRIVGVAYASAENTQLRDTYSDRLISANQDLEDPSFLLGSESVYDATYLMIYAAAAAGYVPELTGSEMALGMRRLLLGTSYDIGPGSISAVLNALGNGDNIALRLTLGEPNWNAARGTRNGIGSVYCMANANSSAEASIPQGPLSDALRYDPDTNMLAAGPLPCIAKF